MMCSPVFLRERSDVCSVPAIQYAHLLTLARQWFAYEEWHGRSALPFVLDENVRTFEPESLIHNYPA